MRSLLDEAKDVEVYDAPKPTLKPGGTTGKELAGPVVSKVLSSGKVSSRPNKVFAGETGGNDSVASHPSVPFKSIYLQGILAIVVCICLVWNFWLIVLNISPNYTINRVMDTESFDNGFFWLFVNPPSYLLWFVVIGLSVVSLGYIAILIKMIVGFKFAIRALPSQSPSKYDSIKQQAASRISSLKDAALATKMVASIAKADGSSKQHIKLLLKVSDLAFETVLLVQVLESGSPSVIIAFFTMVVASNALMCAALMFRSFARIRLVETLVDLLFDMLVAVGCPMLVLLYCLSTFNFPRDKLAVNLEVFPPGWFEQQASVIADPVQTAVIYKVLKSLRISSLLNFFARMGVQASLYLRLQELVRLIYNPKKQRILLPDDLRRCTEMRHLTLEYTHTQTLPDWIKNYTKLEFLHLESKFTSPFVMLPEDMFDNMASLTFIHLAAFIPMQRLPSFQGLTNLKSLTLAVFLMLEELPDLTSLQHLERLLVTCIPSLDSLPDLEPVKNVNMRCAKFIRSGGHRQRRVCLPIDKSPLLHLSS
ncbi:hypothetical protein PHYBOEH_001123 [Phytophthora boehmeriae]|uniref:Uncharacterized protein n=1 Tax=Phytophthora boehmeriae TaxID=109152 RepID=A0A8T1V745_9STRA|nr:hypothetical protein PHYBOEH_001123 [Phytophthora boehmeriae]